MLHVAATVLLWAAASPAELGPVPPGTLRIYLVRHGQAGSNMSPSLALPPEQLDHLTELGREQSQRVGQALRDPEISLLLSSPASRAQETAAELHRVLGKSEVRVEPRLRPLELGSSPSGQPLGWDERIAEWKAGRDPIPPGGESLAQMGERVLALVRSLAQDHDGKSVVLVAHSEVVGAFLGLVRGTPGAPSYPPRIDNGSISVVELTAAGPPVLIFANYSPPR